MFSSPEQKEEAKKKRVEQLKVWKESGEWKSEADKRSPIKVSVDKNSSLISCIRSGDEEGAVNALKKGADPNQSPFLPSTPLHDSLTDSNMNIVRGLVEHGANLNVRDIEGWTPLHVAAHWGHLEAVEYLCEKGADPAALTDDLELPHELADEKDIIEFLLDLLKQRGITYEKILELKSGEAVRMKEDAKKFIEEGKNLNDILNAEGANMLHIAASKNYIELAKFLLDNGMKPNSVEKEGWTALHIACFWGYRDMIVMLVERGCDLSLLTNDEEGCADLPENDSIKTLVQELLEKQEKSRKSSTLSINRTKSISRKNSTQRHQFTKDATRLDTTLQKVTAESIENMRTNMSDEDEEMLKEIKLEVPEIEKSDSKKQEKKPETEKEKEKEKKRKCVIL